MLDINQCPKVIVEADNGINDVSECGKIYTDNADIAQLYAYLLDGSDSHLAGYVRNIEKSHRRRQLPGAGITAEASRRNTGTLSILHIISLGVFQRHPTTFKPFYTVTSNPCLLNFIQNTTVYKISLIQISKN